MRSRTSYFNRTLFLKTVTRFWPIWFIYFAVWFVAMPLVLSADMSWSKWEVRAQANVCSGATTLGVLIGFAAACVAAMAVWSFMYSSRSTSGMACLPLRRECVFVSVSLGGIVPMLCVNVLIFLLSLGVEAFYGVPDAGLLGQWLAAVSLELVFFYGFAIFCAQLTGNLAVLPLVYLVLNFTVYVVETLFEWLATAFVYGAWVAGAGKLAALSPPLGMLKYFEREREYHIVGDCAETVRFYLSGWGALALYAAAGLALAALALWLYRRRRMESAGDVVAVNILKPVFKYCMTFGCALCIGSLLYELSGGGSGVGYAVYNMFIGIADYYRPWSAEQWAGLALMIVFMLVGAFIGYFASEMLIHKSFRVWRGRGRWLGLGVSALVIIALMLSVELDMYGYERRVPEPGRVSSVFIMADSEGATVCEPENIAAAVELHRSVVANKRHYESVDWRETDYENSDFVMGRRSMSLYINYELENGSHLTRQYYGLRFYLDDESSQTDARAAQDLLNTPEAIADRKSTAIEYTADTIFKADIHCRILPGDVEKAAESAEVYDGYGDRYVDNMPKFDLRTGEAVDVEVNATYGYNDTNAHTATWTLTSEEAEELYTQCILPDMADGTIGRVWLITDEEYKNTVYAARISIEARVPREAQAWNGLNAEGVIYYGPPEYSYDYFYTVPTVNSVRTNRWLESHGVILRTVAEAGEL